MNSIAFSLLASSSAGVDEKQEVELTIGSLNILIGPSGLTRLSDPTKPDPSASETETKAILESSERDKIQEKFDTEGKAFETHNNTRDFAAGSSGISN
jgi:hypothetical protein